ncbi:hypothetical protein Ga0074812_11324 [Parafrankia irregularis]|uniref:Secreted protein n=1 Tax=Parafrankia irregularis TaxID=795642 RepID=A0A0S4QSX4_9ACTN|nr:MULTISPECIES: hypothetical protein [Parafrankia]MBE3206250.1 hypothetical protein [Parafrankia sp. CH37]CUU57526.1 hypothetical protein Ga0074812_11324 [Parafrankia irregularis]
MVTRVFYVALGAATGVLVVRQVARAVSALTPTSLAGSLVESMREFAADVAEAMAEREEEIRSALGLDELEASGEPGDLAGGEPSGSGQHLAAPAPVGFDPEQTMRLVPGARRP